MKLKVNHVEKEVREESLSLFGLLDGLGVAGKPGVAVALNKKVVPRGQWDVQSLADNDEVLIISPVQGG